MPPLGPLYPIVDDAWVPADRLADAVAAVARGGARTVQIRAKTTPDRALLPGLLAAARAEPPAPLLLVVDDRADLAAIAAAEAHPDVTVGLHLGQTDLPPRVARRIVGDAMPIGWSTHGPAQVRDATDRPVSYIGFGPVFQTRSKADPDPTVGVDGLRAVARSARWPVVAIGGIDAARAPEVLAAGAEAVAMIGALLGGLDLRNDAGMLALERRTRELVSRLAGAAEPR